MTVCTTATLSLYHNKYTKTYTTPTNTQKDKFPASSFTSDQQRHLVAHQMRNLPTKTVWCGVVWCGVVWCGVVWCGVVWCGVVWCGVVWCGVVWCGVVCLVLGWRTGSKARYPHEDGCSQTSHESHTGTRKEGHRCITCTQGCCGRRVRPPKGAPVQLQLQFQLVVEHSAVSWFLPVAGLRRCGILHLLPLPHVLGTGNPPYGPCEQNG